MGKFTIFKGSNSQFYFNLKASNGLKVLASEGYLSKDSCKNGIQSVKENAPYDSKYERKRSINYQYYFVLKAVNNQVIGTSEMYVSSQGMEDGIFVVKSEAPNASTEDLT